MDPLLEQAQRPWGGRRFFPPGEHPATYRWKMHLKQAEKLREQMVADHREPGDFAQIDEFIALVKDKLAMFEEGESLAKLHYLWARGQRKT